MANNSSSVAPTQPVSAGKGASGALNATEKTAQFNDNSEKRAGNARRNLARELVEEETKNFGEQVCTLKRKVSKLNQKVSELEQKLKEAHQREELQKKQLEALKAEVSGAKEEIEDEISEAYHLTGTTHHDEKWTEYWKKLTGEKELPLFCPCVYKDASDSKPHPLDKSTAGAHVVFSRNGRLEYGVVPVCRGCNVAGRKLFWNCKAALILIPGNLQVAGNLISPGKKWRFTSHGKSKLGEMKSLTFSWCKPPDKNRRSLSISIATDKGKTVHYPPPLKKKGSSDKVEDDENDDTDKNGKKGGCRDKNSLIFLAQVAFTQFLNQEAGLIRRQLHRSELLELGVDKKANDPRKPWSHAKKHKSVVVLNNRNVMPPQPT